MRYSQVTDLKSMSQIGSSLKNLNETFETTHLAVVQSETPIYWTFVEHLPQPCNKKSIKDKEAN